MMCMYMTRGFSPSRWLCTAVCEMPPCCRSLHHRLDFVARQHQIPHRHRLSAAERLERNPSPERERRLELNVSHRHLQIAAWEAEPHHAARIDGAFASERLLDYRPVLGTSAARRGRRLRQGAVGAKRGSHHESGTHRKAGESARTLRTPRLHQLLHCRVLVISNIVGGNGPATSKR